MSEDRRHSGSLGRLDADSLEVGDAGGLEPADEPGVVDVPKGIHVPPQNGKTLNYGKAIDHAGEGTGTLVTR